jgi:carboxyl-terminal processing protease
VLAYLRLIGGPAREPLRLLLQEPGGSRVRVALNRRRIDARPRFEAQRLEGEILHVRFDRFRKPVARLLRQTLERHRDATALILDLRSNTGGDGEEGVRVVAPLLDRPTVIARLSTRTGRPPSALLGLVRLPMVLTAGQTGRQLFGGPIVILINEGTGSTSEVIAASLQEQGRAVVAGSRSCGCALGVLRHRALPNGAALAISEVGLVTARGKRIEGDGVSPDLPVTMNIQDMITGRDPVLSRAIAYLLGQG